MKQQLLILLLLVSTISIAFAQNQVLTFDGVNDHVALGVNAGNGVRTIEMWFRPDADINSSLSNFATLIAKEVSIDNVGEFTLSFQPSNLTDAGSLRFGILENVGDAYYVYSNSHSWTAAKWYHVAAVVDPVEGMMLFIDGIKQASTNSYTVATATNSSPTMIGCWGNLYDRYFHGAIDDVRLSSDARYSSDFTPPCPNLMTDITTVALWNFNEGTGTTAVDSSTNNYDSSLEGATRIFVHICDNSPIGSVSDDGDSRKTLKVYPNPSQGTFQFDLTQLHGRSLNLIVYNSLGKVIRNQTINEDILEVDFENEATGVYYYSIFGGSFSVGGKLVKQ